MPQNNFPLPQVLSPLPQHQDQSYTVSLLTFDFNLNSTQQFALFKPNQQTNGFGVLQEILTPKEPDKNKQTSDVDIFMDTVPIDFFSFRKAKYSPSQEENESGSGSCSGGSSGEKEEKSIQCNDEIENHYNALQQEFKHQGYQQVITDTLTTPPKIKQFMQERKPCNCKGSKCLKMYCDCFKFYLICDGCNCIGCHNLEENMDERMKAMMTIKKRNPSAFNHQLKSCNCKNSQCRLGYCQCFILNMKCGVNCSCQNCENTVSMTRTVRRESQVQRL